MWATLGVAAGAAACGGTARAEPRPIEIARASMGSEFRLTVVTADTPSLQAPFDAIFQDLDRLDGLLSVWKADSDVLRINAAAGDHPVNVSPDTIAVLHAARQVSEWTHGKFDVTFGPLADVWKFDAQNKDDSVPDDAQIRARLPLIDYRRVEIDDAAGTVFVARKGMRIHLGGIGKGYAVERAVAILRQAGQRDFMIQFGGDLYVAGQKDGMPWRLGINDPRGSADRIFAALYLSDGTFSTSGDNARFFFKDGIRYHHILDPSTGQPARSCRSVTIVADSPTQADGLSTGVFILGPDEGMALIERLPHVEGVIVTSTNQVLVSSGLKDRVVAIGQPTDAP